MIWHWLPATSSNFYNHRWSRCLNSAHILTIPECLELKTAPFRFFYLLKFSSSYAFDAHPFTLQSSQGVVLNEIGNVIAYAIFFSENAFFIVEIYACMVNILRILQFLLKRKFSCKFLQIWRSHIYMYKIAIIDTSKIIIAIMGWKHAAKIKSIA